MAARWAAPIQFNGSGGTLKIDGTVMPSATISGLVLGDIIDLAGISFDSNGSTTALSGNVLQVTEHGSSYFLHVRLGRQPERPAS